MADLIPASVPFSAEAGGEDEGRFVLKAAPVVFRAVGPDGSPIRYDFPPDKGGDFEMTAEDVRRAVEAAAEGVPISNEHNQRCFFAGKLGRFVPKAWPDFRGFGGVVKLAKPVLDLVGDTPIRLSANFDRLTKTLKDVTLTHTPRINDAALFAAFAKQPAGDPYQDDRPRGEDSAGNPYQVVTPHGRAAMQALHDVAARSGALCRSPAGKPPGASDLAAAARPREAGMSDAEFTSPDERDALQAIHDTTSTMGARCATMKLHPKKGEALTNLMAHYTETPAPSAREQELERQLAQFRRDAEEREAATAGRIAALEKSSSEARFSAALAASESDVKSFLAANRKRFYGKADFEGQLAVGLSAARDDLAEPREVHFSAADGKPQKGTRVGAWKAAVLALPENPLYSEKVPGPLTAVFAAGEGDPEDAENERLRKAMEARAARDNARNGKAGRGA